MVLAHRVGQMIVNSPKVVPVVAKSMMTGDLNAAEVEWIVQYRINDPRLFLFKVMNPETTLRHVSEAVMRTVCGRSYRG